MAYEQYSNGGRTTLSTGILVGAASPVSVVVVDGSGFPAVGNFRVVIGREIMVCTARTGNTLTCTRAQEGTLLAPHYPGDTVLLGVTAGGLQALLAKGSVRDTLANQPAAGLAGRLFRGSNGVTLDYDDGAAIRSHGPHLPFVPPVSGNYSWVNQGGASFATTHGGLCLTVPASGTDTWRMLVKAVPSAPYTVTMAFIPMMPFLNGCWLAMLLRDSATSKFVTLHVMCNNGWNTTYPIYGVSKWTNNTTWSADYSPTPGIGGIAMPEYTRGPCMWMRLKDDNTNRTYWLSNDGQNWFQWLSVGRTDFITPNQIGFGIDPAQTSGTVAMNVLSWLEA